jgi:hypothetical protein
LHSSYHSLLTSWGLYLGTWAARESFQAILLQPLTYLTPQSLSSSSHYNHDDHHWLVNSDINKDHEVSLTAAAQTESGLLTCCLLCESSRAHFPYCRLPQRRYNNI